MTNEGTVHDLINDTWQSKMNNVLVNSKHDHLIKERASSSDTAMSGAQPSRRTLLAAKE